MGACGQQTAPRSLSKAASVSGKCHSPAWFLAGRSVSPPRLPSPPSPHCPQPTAGWGMVGRGAVGHTHERVAMGLGGKARTPVGHVPWCSPHSAHQPHRQLC